MARSSQETYFSCPFSSLKCSLMRMGCFAASPLAFSCPTWRLAPAVRPQRLPCRPLRAHRSVEEATASRQSRLANDGLALCSGLIGFVIIAIWQATGTWGRRCLTSIRFKTCL